MGGCDTPEEGQLVVWLELTVQKYGDKYVVAKGHLQKMVNAGHYHNGAWSKTVEPEEYIHDWPTKVELYSRNQTEIGTWSWYGDQLMADVETPDPAQLLATAKILKAAQAGYEKMRTEFQPANLGQHMKIVCEAWGAKAVWWYRQNDYYYVPVDKIVGEVNWYFQSRLKEAEIEFKQAA